MIKYISIITIFFSGCLLPGCDSVNEQEKEDEWNGIMADPRFGPSFSEEMSKNCELYIAPFLKDSIIKLNDSIELSIENSWIENYHGNKEKRRLILKLNKSILSYDLEVYEPINGFSKDWSIIRKQECITYPGFRTRALDSNILVITGEFNQKQIDFYVLSGHKRIHDSSELFTRIIGEFSLNNIESLK